MSPLSVAVIGGGPAGQMAAITAANNGHRVTLIEKNEKLGKKLYITGKGRCNLTNNCEIRDVLNNIPRNGKFLHSALHAFPPSAVMEYFEGLGVPLKTERGSRVFPQSDKANDIADAMASACRKAGVELFMPELRYCGDNAAMIGCQGYYEFLAGHTAGQDLNAYATRDISLG